MLIARVLASDGIMTDEERDFLEISMTTFELEPDERERVRALEGWEEAEQVVRAMGVEERRAIVDTLLQAVLTDGRISPHETETVRRLSAALELDG